jgi:hypothetical protein
MTFGTTLVISVYFFPIRLVLTYFETIRINFGLIRIISGKVSPNDYVYY